MRDSVGQNIYFSLLFPIFYIFLSAACRNKNLRNLDLLIYFTFFLYFNTMPKMMSTPSSAKAIFAMSSVVCTL